MFMCLAEEKIRVAQQCDLETLLTATSRTSVAITA